jgi:tetratricopeptide (TPR) repeat protein
MNTSYSAEAFIAHNQAALGELKRAITLRPNRFSLVLARCNYADLQSILVEHLQATTPVIVVALLPQSRNLRHTIALGLPAQPGPALMVTGIDSVQEVEALFKTANLGRDEFPKAFPFPLVIWINERNLALLNRHAPDFKSFAAAPIGFDYPPGYLVHSLHQNANHLFNIMLRLGDDSPYPAHTQPYQPGSTLRTELEFALADLAQTHQPLDDELQASLNFLQGRDALSQGNLDLARYYFDQSLTYWQTQAEETPINSRPYLPLNPPTPTSRQKQAILLFYLGVTWRSWAAVQRVVYQQLLAKAQDCFTACLTIFREDGQLDLVGKFLHPLAEVKQKLGDWEGLAAIAREGIPLHCSDTVRLARDYGYLAEVSLSRGEVQAAQAAAEKALDVLKIADAVEVNRDIPDYDGLAVADRYQRGWYTFLLAQTQIALGQPDTAITQLEEARRQTQPSLDLPLYRRILETLRQQYYNQQDYRAAFHIKLQQRQVDTQFKLRAFIGAGHIQPYESLGMPSDSSTQALLATEIKASGRDQDVAALTARLEHPRYPLITIHGPSGVGKSSILYGGLVPALVKSFPEGRTTLPVLVRSYRDWPDAINQALEVALQRHITPDEETAPPAAEIDAFALLTRLQNLTKQSYAQIVLIFDQFEEFLAEAPDLSQRREFYAFLVACIGTLYLKVVLVLREDYLHYLLEIERGFDLDKLSNDILSRDYRYYLGNFEVSDAKALIRRLTQDAHFYLEEALINQLVADLTVANQVRPIELQVVGAQLQREEIDTLAAYRQLGPQPKETLAQRFLDVAVNDCGQENALLARGILYLLTDVDREERLYRPQKSRENLEEELKLRGTLYTIDQLDLVLEVLVGSGLVFMIPGIPLGRYQLVHDYLVSHVRNDQIPALLGWRG